MSKTFVGFGFGAIQGGLFLPAAYKSGNFSRLVVSEIQPESVSQIRQADGSYACNVAEADHVRVEEIAGLEIFNPLVPSDRDKLVDAIASASELCTALPSFTLYDVGEKASVAALLSEGLERKLADSSLPSAVVYAAENDNRAANRLREACKRYLSNSLDERVSFSETVIAKMCSVVIDRERIIAENLREVTNGSHKSFLVEAFDKILIEERVPADFDRGLTQFISKPFLYPFALTKFHGHNAIHYCLGLEAKERGMTYMHQVREDADLMAWAREAFVHEAGVGLRNKFLNFEDELFTQDGFVAYAEDALERMINPYLRDPIGRVTRDPKRKLGWDDRLVGSIRYAMNAGLNPKKMISSARKSLAEIMAEEGIQSQMDSLNLVWKGTTHSEEKEALSDLMLSSHLDP